MNFKIGKLKIAAILMCSVVAAGSFTYASNHNYNNVMAKTISDLEDEMAANDAEIEKLEEEMADLDKEIENAEYEQSLLQEKIDVQTENLNIINAKIDDINIKISETEDKIQKLETDIENKQKDIDIGLEQFKDRLRAMYVSGNDSLASALVGATDFYDMLSKMELISQVAKHDDELVSSLQTQLEQFEEAQTLLAIEQENLNEELAEQETYKTEFSNTIAELNAAYQTSEKYADELEAERSAKQTDIDQYEKDSAAKEAEIEKIYELARQQAEAEAEEEEEDDYYEDDSYYNDNSSGSSSGSSSSSSSSFNGSLTWPVPGHYVISSYYGSRWGSFHQGIDIADGNTNGAAVVAAEGGTVTSVVTGCPHDYGKNSSCGCNGGYGNYVQISHGDGTSTFYAHLGSVYVSYGQSVSRGETIGTVGSTGWSTGPHLHFEVLIGGSPADPTNYLY
ncbi:MAG: hypothetical protein E7508_03395 [Ruminococcus sp.]|nr:hypothetical protein [Ruminococcus sp.]